MMGNVQNAVLKDACCHRGTITDALMRKMRGKRQTTFVWLLLTNDHAIGIKLSSNYQREGN